MGFDGPGDGVEVVTGLFERDTGLAGVLGEEGIDPCIEGSGSGPPRPSSPPDQRYSIRSYAEGVEAVVAHFGLDLVDLVTHDLGTTTARATRTSSRTDVMAGEP